MTLMKSSEVAKVERVAREIREFVHRDLATLRRQPESGIEIVASDIGALLNRVAGTSVQEIDKLISELQTLRERLHTKGERVQREIVEYATMSQAAMQSTTIIAESLALWKKIPDAVGSKPPPDWVPSKRNCGFRPDLIGVIVTPPRLVFQ